MAAATEIEGARGINPAVDDGARKEFRRALGQFATGVTAMTTLSPEGEPVGLTANSFNSLSIDPPLILWSIARGTPSFDCFRVKDAFAVNVLSSDQESLARQLAQSSVDKFRGVITREGLAGVPLIEGCVAYLECAVWARYPGGDHDIIVGHVQRVFNIGRSPLVFHGGAFRSF